MSVEYRHPWEPAARTVDLRRFTVRRKDVELVALLPSPTADEVVAYARIAGFSRETAPELLEGLSSLRYDSSKTKLRGLVLDLRGNPGGLLDVARRRRSHNRGRLYEPPAPALSPLDLA